MRNCIQNAKLQDMAYPYIQRTIEPVVLKATQQFPALVLTGPRQSGKTTLLKHLFGSSHRYVCLELPEIRQFAYHDPRGFLASYPPPVIFDEVQHVPALLAYIKEQIDANRDRCGQYLLASSQNLLMIQHINETLAGRATVLKLLPLSFREMAGKPDEPLVWQASAKGNLPAQGTEQLWRQFLRGSYPELAANPQLDAQLWLSNYIQTYIERDVRMLRQVGDLSLFESFLYSLAARNGQLFHLSDLARDLGVSVNTVKNWLSVLEASYQIFILRPYYANAQKRLVKKPKVYFTDVGILCYLTGVKDPLYAARGLMGGMIFETAVLMEIVKTLEHRGQQPAVFFWQKVTGTEVDIVVQPAAEQLIPIEVKLTATPCYEMSRSIRKFQKDYPDQAQNGFVVICGAERFSLGNGITALPFWHL